MPSASGKWFKIVNNILEGVAEECPVDPTSVGKLILNVLKSDDNFVGQVDGKSGKEDTYKEMKDRSVRCALWMMKNGILPGDIIASISHDHLDSITPCWASLYIGAPFALLDPDLKHLLAITKPKMVFANEKSSAVVASAAKRANLDLEIITFGEAASCKKFSEVLEHQELTEVENFQCTEIESPDHTALLLCTSGSTGFPKVVAISHSSVIKNIGSIIKNEESKSKTYLCCAPYHWISGITYSFISLLTNGKMIVQSDYEDDVIFGNIEKYKVQLLLITPTRINRLIKSNISKKHDLSSLEHIFVRGSVLSSESRKAFTRCAPNANIFASYGLTELAGTGVEQVTEHKPGSTGFVFKNIKMKVIDLETGKVLGPNRRGEICFKSDSMMTCYHGDPQATKEVIDEEGWLHTGDIGFYDEDGEVFLMGRMKDVIRYNQNNVSPAEIEELLCSHSGVQEACVIGLLDEINYEVPMAFVVPMPESKVTEKELEDLVAAELADYKRLRGGVRFVEKIPLTSSDKMKRSALRELANSLINKENPELQDFLLPRGNPN